MKWDEMTNEQKDRLIHEKVMKRATVCLGKLIASRVDVPSRAGGTAYTYWQLVCDTCEMVGSADSEDAIDGEHPSEFPVMDYSTDMNAAWQIVEKLGEKLLNIRLYREEGFSAKYCVNIWMRDGGRIVGSGYSNTSMSDAICRAALKAMGVEIDG